MAKYWKNTRGLCAAFWMTAVKAQFIWDYYCILILLVFSYLLHHFIKRHLTLQIQTLCVQLSLKPIEIFVHCGNWSSFNTPQLLDCLIGSKLQNAVSSAFQVSVFEVEAVSLGKLQKVLLRCEANIKSQHWYCDKVIVREAQNNSEYVFNCER